MTYTIVWFIFFTLAAMLGQYVALQTKRDYTFKDFLIALSIGFLASIINILIA